MSQLDEEAERRHNEETTRHYQRYANRAKRQTRTVCVIIVFTIAMFGSIFLAAMTNAFSK